MRLRIYEAQGIHRATINELFIGPNNQGSRNLRLQSCACTATGDRRQGDAGYLHRALREAHGGAAVDPNLAITPRICVPDPAPMEVAYVLAVEDLCGLEVPDRAQWLRVMELELSRIAAHLFTFGGHAATTGMYSPMFWGVADRDLVLDLFEELCGGRVYHIYNIPGGGPPRHAAGFAERVSNTLDYLESRLPDYDNLLFTNQVFVQRARGTGPSAASRPWSGGDWAESARHWAQVRRAPGRPLPDLRSDRLRYPDEEAGDALARALVRRAVS